MEVTFFQLVRVFSLYGLRNRSWKNSPRVCHWWLAIIKGQPQVSSGQAVTVAAEAGDSTAQEIVRSAGGALGNSVGFLVNVLDPQAVIVGGGLGPSHGLYWESFVASNRKHIWSDISRAPPILHAQLGNDAGLIGAAATIWKLGSGPLRNSFRV